MPRPEECNQVLATLPRLPTTPRMCRHSADCLRSAGNLHIPCTGQGGMGSDLLRRSTGRSHRGRGATRGCLEWPSNRSPRGSSRPGAAPGDSCPQLLLCVTADRPDPLGLAVRGPVLRRLAVSRGRMAHLLLVCGPAGASSFEFSRSGSNFVDSWPDWSGSRCYQSSGTEHRGTGDTGGCPSVPA